MRDTEFPTVVTSYKKWYRLMLITHMALVDGDHSVYDTHKESVAMCETLHRKLTYAVRARIEASVEKALEFLTKG